MPTKKTMTRTSLVRASESETHPLSDFRAMLLESDITADGVVEIDAARLAGAFVLKARHASKLSQEELAGRIGMRQPNISRLENATRDGNGPTIGTLLRIAHACGGSLRLEFAITPPPKEGPI
jgi:ribosome-binding protein aMBF1 (putative translation factor)